MEAGLKPESRGRGSKKLFVPQTKIKYKYNKTKRASVYSRQRFQSEHLKLKKPSSKLKPKERMAGGVVAIPIIMVFNDQDYDGEDDADDAVVRRCSAVEDPRDETKDASTTTTSTRPPPDAGQSTARTRLTTTTTTTT